MPKKSTTTKKVAPLTRTKRLLKNKKDKIAKLQGIDPAPVHRPKSLYSEVIADLICGQISNGKSAKERSLKFICSQEGYPSASTVSDWINYPDEDARPGFRDKYLKAKELGYHLMADEIVEIADDSGKDKKKIIVKGVEIEVIDHENINRDRLRVDARKFIVSKTLPKIYGDKVSVEVSGTIDLVAKLAAARQRLQKEETTIAEEAQGPGLLGAEVENV